ncbi:MAG: putative adenylate kinase chloroplastic-like [Trebouxia sp. A1-2]|nr:MAG: putative adenylate kinase chloroplastic-like [Trebouxia sp. A1-2]
MHSINCSSCSQATLVQRRRPQHRPIASIHTAALTARRQSHREEQQKPLFCLVHTRRASTVKSSRLKHIVASSNGSHSKEPMRVMISGAPATGKGTQCSRIVEKFGLVHISAGDLLRAEVAAGTTAGKEAASYMDSGNLVPNSVVVEMVVNRLEQPDVQEHGWLLDGYPRSGDQAEAIVQKGIKPDLFVLISVPDEDLVDRVAGRRLDPETGEIYHMKHKPPPEDIEHRLIQRSDDTAEKVKTRLHNHHSNVDAVLGYYQDQLVDGTQSMDSVFSAIDEHLSKLSESRSHALAA